MWLNWFLEGPERVLVVSGPNQGGPLQDDRVRTFRLERKPAGGRCHALAIAEQQHLADERVKERIRP